MSFGPLELIIILAIVLLLFGTKRLRSLGNDLGGAIKGFRRSMNETDKSKDQTEGETIDAQAESIDKKSTD